MPSWTGPTPSGCPSPQVDASLAGGAEVRKRPNFIEFYEISRSLHSDKTRTGSGEQDAPTTAATREKENKEQKVRNAINPGKINPNSIRNMRK
jgi:hypothetical protein